MSCQHDVLCTTPSPYANQVGYQLPAAATASSGLKKKRTASRVGSEPTVSFPGPLVLPGDDLALDPDYPAQSIREWLDDKDRNPVTAEKRTIYVVPPPATDSATGYVQSWTRPAEPEVQDIPSPKISQIIEYLSAFYDGLEIKLFPGELCFTSWGKTGSKSRGKAVPVGLKTASECIRIRTRDSLDGVYARQLNLDDLLDVAISILPDDAYALLLLTEHDLFEDEEDLFVCGRAYGGSRVAVVSTARYHPGLDSQQSVERLHAWPASHCAEYSKQCCDNEETRPVKRRKKITNEPIQRACPALTDAVSALSALPSLLSLPSAEASSGLWFGRVCRTAAHELAHCAGLDHCNHGFACLMQGSSSIQEDARQPPYLCPVDLSKVLRATAVDPKHRYQSLLSFCQKYEEIHLFSAFAAWIRKRLQEI